MALQLKARRRGVAAFWILLGMGLAVLVGLPVIGLARIDRATDKSHDYTRITGTVEELTTGVLQLVTGSLAQFGATGNADTRAGAVEAIRQAREQVASLEAESAAAENVGIAEAVERQLVLVRAILDPADQFVREIDSGLTTQTAPSTDTVVGAAGAILQGRSTFSNDVKPVAAQVDQDRREALRDARWLLVAGVVFFVFMVIALGTLNRRRIEKVFVAESARRDSAERLAAHRADVVNMASHELRNPLTALTMASQLIVRAADTGDPDELRELATDAHIAALRCNALVNELLDLGRLDADRLHLSVGATLLSAPLKEAVEMSRAHHGDREVSISGKIDAAVSADADRLRVILRNLVDNAFKYSPADTPIFVTVSQGEGKVRIDVRDQGAGVPAEFRERIFHRFERMAAPGHASGVGIGLFLSRELARRMNGEIRCAESDLGARFQLELPAAA